MSRTIHSSMGINAKVIFIN